MKTWGWTAGCAALLVTGAARGDNTEPFFYSDDAAMTAGAVGAVTRDTGAIWYQPAGLGGIQRGAIDLSGSAFGLRIRTVPNAVGTTFPGGAKRSVTLESNDIFSAPHALGFVRRISDKVSLGVGLYVTLRDIRTASNDLDVQAPALGEDATNGTYRQRLDVTVEQIRYHFGPAIGWEIRPGLRVGASLFGTYGKTNGFLQFLIGQQATLSNGAPSTFLAIGQSRIAFSYFGLQSQVGLQFDADEDWTLSLLVRSPEILLSSTADGAALQSSSLVIPGVNPAASFTLTKAQPDAAAGTIISPARLVGGIARKLGERSWISAEVDVQTPFTNDLAEQNTVVNGRVGARVKLSDRWGLGGGVYTDFSPLKALGDTFGDEKVDEVGGTFGVELRTPLSLADKPAPDALVLSTTLALKYGVGFGQFRPVDTDLTSEAEPPARKVDVVYHAIVPYIGSSIFF